MVITRAQAREYRTTRMDPLSSPSEDQVTQVTNMLQEMRTENQDLKDRLVELEKRRDLHENTAIGGPSELEEIIETPERLTTTIDYSTAKFDQCPRMGKTQGMREWVNYVLLWLLTIKSGFKTGGPRARINIAISSALDDRPRVKSAWLRVLGQAIDDTKKTPPIAMPTLKALVETLAKQVLTEELTIAQEEFRARDRRADESYSEYRLALMTLCTNAYPNSNEDDTAERTLKRFVKGMGKAGRSVRLQAPTTIEDAIAKGIAFDLESNIKETEGTAMHAREFKGNCHECSGQGHRARDCPNKKVGRAYQAQGVNNPYRGRPNVGRGRGQPQYGGYNNNNPWQGGRGQGFGQNNQQNGPNQGARPKNKSEVDCYVCGAKGHYARECTARKGQRQ